MVPTRGRKFAHPANSAQMIKHLPVRAVPDKEDRLVEATIAADMTEVRAVAKHVKDREVFVAAPQKGKEETYTLYRVKDGEIKTVRELPAHIVRP